MQGFYLVVHRQADDSFVERIPLTLPNQDSAQWSRLLQEGLRKRFDHPDYGLTTWVKLLPRNHNSLNFILTHLANGASTDYYFTIEAASVVDGQPSVRLTKGAAAGLPTVNPLYSIHFDTGARANSSF